MLNPSSTFIATLIALPSILTQSTNSTANATTSVGEAASINSSTAAATSVPFTAVNFTPSLATSTTCGTAQQNFNQCINKVGKDINSCTDNVCLCQTYANIAACYNGCPELESQGDSYKAQSSQYCTIAGVKPNTTATVVTPTTTNTSSSSTSSNTTPIRNNTSSNSSTNAANFSAAKSAAPSSSPVSLAVVLSGSLAALFLLLL